MKFIKLKNGDYVKPDKVSGIISTRSSACGDASNARARTNTRPGVGRC